MTFDIETGPEILRRTPSIIASLVRDLPESWTHRNEGPDTWSVFDVLGHLIHGEETDWIPRARVILEHGSSRAFEPFDRFAQFEASNGKSLSQLLDEFAAVRTRSLAQLTALRLTPADMARPGKHPDLGGVTLGQLLSTWVAHDLDHIAQIARVMANSHGEAVGPWEAYLRVLK
jgi:uncharacterized damage-inducible protein DinB